MDIESVKHPTTCNICGGPVIYCSNSRIYGREYGSGWCYYCTQCGAYVGTHKPRPREALGLLADARMRKGKQMCHGLFDPLWKNAKCRTKRRNQLYAWLANQMQIPVAECHFCYFNIEQLLEAYRHLQNFPKEMSKSD